MKTDTQRVGSVDVFTLIGALADEDAGSFAVALGPKLEAATPRVVISLKEVPYLDSVGLEVLLSAAETLQKRNVPLKLASLTPTDREILEVTGLTPHFAIFESVEDAVRSYM
jgi:anti-sigma B factor antagonist